MSVITIKLKKSDATGTLSYNGKTYKCCGLAGYSYVHDTTITGYKEEVHYTQKGHIPLKWAVLWDGDRGVYFHEWATLTPSHGCIHLLAADAKSFYDSINGRTRVLFDWV